MLKIWFFGNLGELAGCERIEIPFDHCLITVACLRDHLCCDNEALAKVLNEPQIMVEVNQQLVDWDNDLQEGDEIAFLQVVSGG